MTESSDRDSADGDEPEAESDDRDASLAAALAVENDRMRAWSAAGRASALRDRLLRVEGMLRSGNWAEGLDNLVSEVDALYTAWRGRELEQDARLHFVHLLEDAAAHERAQETSAAPAPEPWEPPTPGPGETLIILKRPGPLDGPDYLGLFFHSAYPEYAARLTRENAVAALDAWKAVKRGRPKGGQLAPWKAIAGVLASLGLPVQHKTLRRAYADAKKKLGERRRFFFSNVRR